MSGKEIVNEGKQQTGVGKYDMCWDRIRDVPPTIREQIVIAGVCPYLV